MSKEGGGDPDQVLSVYDQICMKINFLSNDLLFNAIKNLFLKKCSSVKVGGGRGD